MKHIRNLWNLLKQEISLWKYEKQELVKGICYIVMIAWLFFDRIAFAILLIPYLFVFMKQQRIHKVHREKEKLRKEFREMMISIGNSLSAGYSIENALKTAKNDLEMYEEHSLLAKELQLLINKLKMNEPVDNLLFDMAYIVRCGFRRMHAHFNRIVFGWKPKRIPPHWMYNIIPLLQLIATPHVGNHIPSPMSYMKSVS